MHSANNIDSIQKWSNIIKFTTCLYCLIEINQLLENLSNGIKYRECSISFRLNTHYTQVCGIISINLHMILIIHDYISINHHNISQIKEMN